MLFRTSVLVFKIRFIYVNGIISISFCFFFFFRQKSLMKALKFKIKACSTFVKNYTLQGNILFLFEILKCCQSRKKVRSNILCWIKKKIARYVILMSSGKAFALIYSILFCQTHLLTYRNYYKNYTICSHESDYLDLSQTLYLSLRQ